MATFSIGEAAKSGFRLIGEKPKAFLMWSAAYWLLSMLPVLLFFAWFYPDMMAAFSEAAKTAGPGGPSTEEVEALLGMQGRMATFQFAQFVGGMVAVLLVYGAVFRATLEPESSARWYLRLGSQEGWMALVSLVGGAIAFMAAIIGFAPFALAIAAVNITGGGDSTLSWVLLGALFVGLLGLGWWAALRLSMALPMSFAQRKFLLFESWSLTKGHAGKIFLTQFTVLAAVVVVEFLIFGGLLLAVIFGAGFAANSSWLTNILDAPLAPQLTLVGILVAALLSALMAVFVTAFYTVVSAPSAYIYRALTEPAQPMTAPGA